MNGSKRPGRDKILALCIAAGLDLKETKRALESAGEAPLYSRNKRDAIILYAINNRLDIIGLNDLLEKADEQLLT